MPYPVHIGQRPLEVREAYAALEQYANDYGEEALLLLMHASVPETLRADLLDLIRVNFLPAQGTDRSLEADVLFAPVTTSLGAGYYRIDPQVRWHCMALLRSRYRGDVRPRALRVAELLWRYVDAVEKRSGGAIDPQLAEYLAIQRWVALAFISPASAAHAFADALKHTASDPVAARVQLGGLAAAIEMPLAREQTLLAYARGMDALSRGNGDEGERILGALGNEEIRVGKVVLRPPSELLAEAGVTPGGHMSEDSTEETAPSAPLFPSASRRTLIVRQPEPGTLRYLFGEARAKTELTVRYQTHMIDSLLPQLPSSTDDFGERVRSLAQMLLPPELATQPGDRAHLVLSQTAAALPWEALLAAHEGSEQRPVAITRSLDGVPPPKRPRSTGGHALLIADPASTETLPDVPEGLPPLQGVRDELGAIDAALTAAGYTVMVSERENADEVMKRLFARDFEILVVLGRSVHEYALDEERMKRPTKRPMKRAAKAQPAQHRVSGFILSDGIFLTPAEIGKMRKLPQLVLLNDCHASNWSRNTSPDRLREPASASMTAELLRMGVDCVLAPGWTVDDSAAASWSQRLFEGMGRGESLEVASLAARIENRERFPLLSTWAAWQAWGVPDFSLSPPDPSQKHKSAS